MQSTHQQQQQGNREAQRKTNENKKKITFNKTSNITIIIKQAKVKTKHANIETQTKRNKCTRDTTFYC